MHDPCLKPLNYCLFTNCANFTISLKYSYTCTCQECQEAMTEMQHWACLPKK